MTTISFSAVKRSLLRDIENSRSFEDLECAIDGNLALARELQTPCRWTLSEAKSLLAKANGEIANGECVPQEEMETFIRDFE